MCIACQWEEAQPDLVEAALQADEHDDQFHPLRPAGDRVRVGEPDAHDRPDDLYPTRKHAA